MCYDSPLVYVYANKLKRVLLRLHGILNCKQTNDDDASKYLVSYMLINWKLNALDSSVSASKHLRYNAVFVT